MANERLRSAILASGLGLQGFADELHVDRKTVERWVSGRAPYRRHQFSVASLLGLDVTYLWPDGRPADEVAAAGQAELLTFYPHRSAVPDELWLDTFSKTESRLDILVYSGLFLVESTAFHKLIRAKSKAGVPIRILLGDPDGQEIAKRGSDEGLGEGMASRVLNAQVLCRSLMKLKNAEFRLHDTVLYNSIFRADDEMLVNTHVHGVAGYLAPAIHLRHVPGADLFTTYAESFERVWDDARPVGDGKRAA